MYVRVLHFTCREDVEKPQIQSVFRMIVDHARSADGFMGSTLMLRENACMGMAMMYWRDEVAAGAAGPEIVRLLGEHAYSLMQSAPEIEGYHVIESEILPEAR
jgi:hypothetical protein